MAFLTAASAASFSWILLCLVVQTKWMENWCSVYLWTALTRVCCEEYGDVKAYIAAEESMDL